MVYRALNSNKEILKDKIFGENTKIKIYATTIRPIVRYATETANPT